MKISIVMATYNGQEYLYEQLDSIRNQSRKADEVLIFDDRSKDQTVEMIRDYIKKYQLENTWHIAVNEKNLGYANNFHEAMKAAKGEYIFFADQDDIWDCNKIKKTEKIMDEYPEIALLCSDYTPFSSADKAPKVTRKQRRRMKKDGTLEKIELNSKNIYIASLGCVMSFRKEFRDQIEPYWIDTWAHDDYVWKLAQCLDGCYAYHEALIHRRLHNHNVSMKKMHDLNQRIGYFKDVNMADTQMYKLGKAIHLNEKKMKLIRRHIKAIQLREGILAEKKFLNCFRLLAYLDCYHSLKSVLMEPYMALRYKNN